MMKFKRVVKSHKLLRNLKSQAAMEFLMTYGWAILVVLVVIGALAYFGVLNPGRLLPEKCTLPIGLYCKNHKISASSDNILLELENGRGTGIIIRNITATSDNPPIKCTDFTAKKNETYEGKNGTWIPNGASDTFTLTGCGDIPDSLSKSGAKYKVALTISWYKEDATEDFTHTMEGELLAKVEP